MTSTIGIPIKLLNEAQVCCAVPCLVVSRVSLTHRQGHIVTLEITSGQTYRGRLLEGRFLLPPPPPALHTLTSQPRTT